MVIVVSEQMSLIEIERRFRAEVRRAQRGIGRSYPTWHALESLDLPERVRCAVLNGFAGYDFVVDEFGFAADYLAAVRKGVDLSEFQ